MRGRPTPVLGRRSFTLALAAWLPLLAGARVLQRSGQSVTVRNAQLVVMRELRTPAELHEFQRHWSERRATDQTSAQVQDWSFTLDIVAGQHVERWLYQSNGLTTRVADSVQRVYRMPHPAALNSLIGAPRY